MAQSVFSARFEPTNSVSASSTEFDVTANIFDGTGQYSGMDVSVGDIVFLDCFASLSALNTVARYVVTQIWAQFVGSVNVRLQWDDDGPIVDPNEVLDTFGFISAASPTNALAWHAAPTLHNFPDYIVQYSRNKDLWATIDAQLDGGPENALKSVDVTVHPLQILQLDTVPVQLLAAPGANYFTVIDSVEVKLDFNTTPYTGGGSDLFIDYETTPVQNMSIDGGVILSPATTTRFGQPDFVLPDTVPQALNQAIVLTTSQPFLSGDSNLVVRLRYRIYSALV